jgi:predicted Holliday junction resolvase-like endonuclease
MEFIIVILIILLILLGYIIYNLMIKVEKLENVNETQENYILEFYQLVKYSEDRIKEIDSKQLFQSDDEVGFFFTNLKNIQELISEYVKFIK